MEEKHPRWGARTSNPAEGVHDVFGEFDSHLFRPPSTFVVVPRFEPSPVLAGAIAARATLPILFTTNVTPPLIWSATRPRDYC